MSIERKAAKVGRQNRNPKSRFHLRWDELNYDFLLRLSRERGVSVAVVANEIVREKRLNVPRGSLEAS